MKKLALCVGNNYPGTRSELSGCVNDAFDWEALLVGEGYQVNTLLEATKDQIVGGLSAMIVAAGRYDRIVFTYSGHGTWVPDYDGDEIDRRDEALVPADAIDDSSKLLTDDEIAVIMSQAKTTGVLFLSDSCHSGTVSRFASLAGVTVKGQPRFLPPHMLGIVDQDVAREAEERVSATPRPFNSLISGCTDFQYSYDAWFGSRANGAFTRAAVSRWKPGVSLNSWYNAIREELPSADFAQTPQLAPANLYRKYTRAL